MSPTVEEPGQGSEAQANGQEESAPGGLEMVSVALWKPKPGRRQMEAL